VKGREGGFRGDVCLFVCAVLSVYDDERKMNLQKKLDDETEGGNTVVLFFVVL